MNRPSAAWLPGVLTALALLIFAVAPVVAANVSEIPMPEQSEIRFIDASQLNKDHLSRRGNVIYIRLDVINSAFGNRYIKEADHCTIYGKRTVEINFGKKTCLIDGTEYEFSSPVLKKNDKIMVPAREYARIFGGDITLVSGKRPDKKPPHKKSTQIILPRKSAPASTPDKKKIEPEQVSPGQETVKPPAKGSPITTKESLHTGTATAKYPPVSSSPPHSYTSKISLKPKAKSRYGFALNAGYHRPKGNGVDDLNFPRRSFPGISFFYDHAKYPRLVLQYSRYKSTQTGKFLNINESSTLTLKDWFLSSYLTIPFGKDNSRFQPFVLLGFSYVRTKLFYENNAVKTWQEFSPLVFEVGLGMEYFLQRNLSLQLQGRCLKGDETVTLTGIDKEITFKQDDIFLEFGTNFYFE